MNLADVSFHKNDLQAEGDIFLKEEPIKSTKKTSTYHLVGGNQGNAEIVVALKEAITGTTGAITIEILAASDVEGTNSTKVASVVPTTASIVGDLLRFTVPMKSDKLFYAVSVVAATADATTGKVDAFIHMIA